VGETPIEQKNAMTIGFRKAMAFLLQWMIIFGMALNATL
jgi:hypothetical protein